MKNTIFIFGLFAYLGAFGQVSALLDTNDISARIYADGRLFNGKFEVPKGSGNNTIDQLSIWIGGYDESNNLHLAVQSDGKTATEFFFGPIANNYNDPSYILRYNKVWKINKSIIDYHISNFRNPGYIVPNSIANWPGNGNTSNGEALILAPFFDFNFNDIYEPEKGDFPDIRGDQAIFFMDNDKKETHSQTNSDPLWLELHGMAYSFASKDSALNQSIFLHLQFINRSPGDLQGVYIGLLTDANIGNKEDDFVGSDSISDLTYTYNALGYDSIYGKNPPVQGIQITDVGAISEAIAKTGFINFNNNEHNEPIGTSPPETGVEYYRYLIGSWRDGTLLTRSGLGYNPGSRDSTRYVFDGNPIDSIKKGWTEMEAGNIPGDRKGLKTIGPFYFQPNSSICITIAFPYARDFNGNNLGAIPLLRQRVKAIQDFHDGTDFHYSCFPISTKVNEAVQLKDLISIYPNPNNGNFQIELNQFTENKKYHLEIYNALGIKIYQFNPNITIGTTIKQFNNLTINLSSQPAGIYIAKIFNGEKMYSKKIIIQ